MGISRKQKANRATMSISITNAQEALSNDQRSRQRKYFISMMVRTGCFVAAIFLLNPYRWFAMAGAVVLPYVAVVIANAGRENVTGTNAILKNSPREITGN